MWWVIASGALHNFNMYALGQFLASFLIRYHHVSVRNAGYVVMVVYGLSGIVGLVGGGMLADRLYQKRVDGRLIVGMWSIVICAPFMYLALLRPGGEILAFSVLMGVAALMLLVTAAVSGCLNTGATPVPVAGGVAPVPVKVATATPAAASAPPSPTATPLAPPALPSATATAAAVPATALPAPGPTVSFTGKYFTMHVPAEWGTPMDNVFDARQTMVEDSTWYWRVGQTMLGVIHATAGQDLTPRKLSQ